MPVPTPSGGESQSEFMKRCMHAAGVKDISTAADPQKQRVAVCLGAWRKGSMELSDEEAGAVDLLSMSPDELAEVDKWLAEIAAADVSRETEQAEAEEHAVDLKGVEIFRAGEWNGDKYDERDLEDMIAAFTKVGYRPPLKLGHDDKSGSPAYGWVTGLRRIGDKLVADFSGIPDALGQMIKDRRFDSVSSEIFWNLKRGGEKFRRALKAVALLGGEIPAVGGLKPLSESFTVPGGIAREYTLDIEELSAMPADQREEQRQPEAAQDNRPVTSLEVRRLQEQIDAMNADLARAREAEKRALEAAKAEKMRIPELSQQLSQLREEARLARIERKLEDFRIPALREHMRAFYELATSGPEEARNVKFTLDSKQVQFNAEEVADDLIARMNKQVEWRFQEMAHAASVRRDDEPSLDDPGKEVDRLTHAHMRSHRGIDYSTAMHAVLSDPMHADLKVAYATRRI